jgi:large subunit ribosomal protein L6
MRYVSVVAPGGVSLSIDGNTVIAKGPKGQVKSEFKVVGVKMHVKDGKFEAEGPNSGSINTVKRRVLMMLDGAANGFSRKMVIRYAHFPVKVSVKGSDLMIDNFYGEKKHRKAKIVNDTKVKIAGQELVVEGPSLDDVTQTVANIRQATKTREKDKRVFQDGIYATGE